MKKNIALALSARIIMRKSVFFLLLVPFYLGAQKNYPALLDSFMLAQKDIFHFNGNVLVAQVGHIIYQKPFGYRNYDTKELLDNNSVFELASVSKQFTAMGILILIERGKLKLSDSLRKFFPELPYNNITIQNLLTHTSGLPDAEDLMSDKWDHKKVAFNKDLIHFLATENIPPNFQPGMKWEYSNTAYVLLASIIEKLSGLTFNEFMRQNIFEPLGMKYSRVYNTRRSTKETIPNYAYGYVYSDSLKRYILPDSLPDLDYVTYLDGIVGDGIINSTTGDLLKWDRALKAHVLISTSLQAAMFSAQSVVDTINHLYYGYGEFMGKLQVGDYQFGDFITHDGGWPGYRTKLARILAKDITVIILSNNETNSQSIFLGIAGILFDKSVQQPYLHKEISIDTNLLGRYVGTYKTSSDIPTIFEKNGKLYRRKKGAADVELKPESNTKFFYGDGSDRQIEFETDQNGRIIKVWLISGGLKLEMTKLTL
jgi:CubicO group peptidase (beta-lactamase class C family)